MNDVNFETLTKAKEGDTNALYHVLKDTEKEVYSFLYFMNKTECEISDIVQDVLLKVTSNLKELKDVKRYKSWLNKIVIRKYYDSLRRINKKCNKFADKDIGELDEENKLKDINDPMDKCIECELMGLIKKSVCKLNEPYRLALIMREFEGMTYDEISKITNVNVGTVKSRIARARSKMKDLITPYMEQK